MGENTSRVEELKNQKKVVEKRIIDNCVTNVEILERHFRAGTINGWEAFEGYIKLSAEWEAIPILVREKIEAAAIPLLNSLFTSLKDDKTLPEEVRATVAELMELNQQLLESVNE